jgi:hypothetical protein
MFMFTKTIALLKPQVLRVPRRHYLMSLSAPEHLPFFLLSSSLCEICAPQILPPYPTSLETDMGVGQLVVEHML